MKNVTHASFPGLMILLLSQLIITPVTAQENPPKGAQDAPGKIIHMAPEQLKAYEGVFQNEENWDQQLQFKADTDCLQATLLYVGVTLKIYPLSETEFYGKRGEPVDVRFIKNVAGNFDQLSFWNNMRWNRLANYKPVVRQEVPHTLGQLKPFEGKYRLKDDPDDVIRITAAGRNLVVKQLWDGKETMLYPMSDRYFYNAAEACPAKFMQNESGAITTVFMLNKDLFEKIKDQ